MSHYLAGHNFWRAVVRVLLYPLVVPNMIGGRLRGVKPAFLYPGMGQQKHRTQLKTYGKNA